MQPQRATAGRSWAEYKEQRSWTFDVLTRIHSDLASRLSQDEESIGRLRQILRSDEHNKLFASWLRELTYPAGDGKEEADRVERVNSCLTAADQVRGNSPSTLAEMSVEVNDRQHVSRLLRDGLGLVFIRYNEARGTSYYHWLISSLVGESTRSLVMNTLFVPRHEGTVGWIADMARRSTAVEVIPLYSCFADLRGSVAAEDLLVGNRSFLAFPLLPETVNAATPTLVDQGESASSSERPAALGIVFAFFPVDGLFVDAHNARTTFVAAAAEVFRQFRRELLMALEVEAESVLVDITTPYDVTEGGQSFVRPDHLLYPEYDDPLGFLLAGVRESGHTGNASLRIAFREAALFERLFKYLQVGCLCPTQWASAPARRMGSWASMIESGEALLHMPLWQGQGYESATDLHRYHSGAHGGWVNHLERVSSPPAASERFLDSEDGINGALSLYGDIGNVVDLVIPLSEDASGSPVCGGFVRVNCVCNSDEPESPFQALHRLFTRSFGVCSAKLSLLIRKLEPRLEAATLAQIKSARDLRFSIAEAIAEELADCLIASGRAGKTHLDLISHVVKVAPIEASETLSILVEEIEASFRAFGEAVRESAPNSLPEVLAVSVWLNTDRALLDPPDSSAAAEILWRDPGLPRFLSTLAEFLLRNPADHSEWSWALSAQQQATICDSQVLISPSLQIESLATRWLDEGVIELELRASESKCIQLRFRKGRFPRAEAFRFSNGLLSRLVSERLSNVPGMSDGSPDYVDLISKTKVGSLNVFESLISAMQGHRAKYEGWRVVQPHRDYGRRFFAYAEPTSNVGVERLRKRAFKAICANASQYLQRERDVEYSNTRIMLKKTTHALRSPATRELNYANERMTAWKDANLDKDILEDLLRLRGALSLVKRFCEVMIFLRESKDDAFRRKAELHCLCQELSEEYYFREL
jgi:hypothetical protein